MEASYNKPLPKIDEVNRSFWEAAHRREFRRRRLVADDQVPDIDLTPRRRHVTRPVVLAGAALVTAAAGAIVLPVVLAGHARAAYAITRGPNGTVQMSISGAVSRPADLQHKLQVAGARVHVFTVGASAHCHQPSRNLPLTAGILRMTGPNQYVIDPARIPPNATLVAQVQGTTGPARVRVSLSRDGTPPCPSRHP